MTSLLRPISGIRPVVCSAASAPASASKVSVSAPRLASGLGNGNVNVSTDPNMLKIMYQMTAQRDYFRIRINPEIFEESFVDVSSDGSSASSVVGDDLSQD